MGPMADQMGLKEVELFMLPLYVPRFDVGFIPYTPLNAAGARIEPPISVPIPTGEPRHATRAPSPPEDPPGVSRVLCGFRVRPQRFETDSMAFPNECQSVLRNRIKKCSSYHPRLRHRRLDVDDGSGFS